MNVLRPGLLMVALASFGLLTLGLGDGMLGVAWPSISAGAGVPLSALGLLVPVFAAAYITVALASGRLSDWLGVGGILIAGAALLAAGLLVFAASSNWGLLLTSAWIAGMGGGALDSGFNTYAAERLGIRATNWIHAFYGVGAVTGPSVMTGLLVWGRPWQTGYVISATVAGVLALGILASRRGWRINGPSNSPGASLPTASSRSGIWLGAALFAVCTGLEVSAGQWTFTLLTVGRGFTVASAGAWVAAYFAGFTAGRILVGTLPIRVPAQKVLRACTVASLLSAGLLWLNLGAASSLIGVVGLGLFLGPVFPSLVATTRARIGEGSTSSAIGFQLAAAGAGGMIVPAGVGVALAVGGFEAIASSIVGAAAALAALHEIAARRSHRLSSRGAPSV